MNSKVSPNAAVKALLDHELMIGRHRPIVGQWIQAWVDEQIASEKVEDGVDPGIVANKLKKLLLKEIEDSFLVVVENTFLNEGWRKGTPAPRDPVRGKEVTVKFWSFRNSPRQDERQG